MDATANSDDDVAMPALLLIIHACANNAEELLKQVILIRIDPLTRMVCTGGFEFLTCPSVYGKRRRSINKRRWYQEISQTPLAYQPHLFTTH